MKKLVFLFVAFAAVSFASCGNKAANSEASEETVEATVEEVAAETDTTACCCKDTTACCCKSDSTVVSE